MIRREGRDWRRGFGCATALVAALAMTSCDLYFGEGSSKQEDDECSASTDSSEDFGAPDIGFPERPLDGLGETTQLEDSPPPISGGTMAITPDGLTVVVADSDRDQVSIVSLTTRSVLTTVALEEDDEPGRVVIDDANRAHVALRRGGGYVTIDVATGELLGRHAVCPAARGLSFDGDRGFLYVSCHGGEVLATDPETGAVLQQVKLPDVGLRDVVVTPAHIYVSVFRTADVIALERDTLAEVTRMRPPAVPMPVFDPATGRENTQDFEPTVAWRMQAGDDGGVIVLHQRARDGEVKIDRGGYGGDPCGGGIIHGAITPMRVGEPVIPAQALNGLVLPVDFALVDEGFNAVVTSAGASADGFSAVPPVTTVPVGVEARPFECFFGDPFDTFGFGGPPTSVVAAGNGSTVVVQHREPASLLVFTNSERWAPELILLSTETRRDTGHDIFHMDSGAGIACASCHPEGGDDARTWTFKCIGPRRTQSLQFGLLGTEPFHWDGDMDDIQTLMGEVFVGRMAGGQPRTDQIDAVASWLDKQTPPPRSAPADVTAVERGQNIFFNPAVGCATCHSGAKLTNNLSFDVGTGGAFQVPSLVGIANRAPFMHTGCAPTLRARFTDPACGGGDRHGVVSQLTAQQIDDLIAYLETL